MRSLPTDRNEPTLYALKASVVNEERQLAIFPFRFCDARANTARAHSLIKSSRVWVGFDSH
jgi:hypothetical protein